jgi:uncharacterized cupin superfamily protein
MKIAALADVKALSQLIRVQLSRVLGLKRTVRSDPAISWPFPTPSVPHHLKNPSDQDLVYLMGGENRKFEVADFPRLGKRMVKSEKRLRSMTYPMQSRLVH